MRNPEVEAQQAGALLLPALRDNLSKAFTFRLQVSRDFFPSACVWGSGGGCPSPAKGLAGVTESVERGGSQQEIIRDRTLGRTGDAQRYSKNKYSKELRYWLENDAHGT